MTRVALGVVLVVLMTGVAQAEQPAQAQQQSRNCVIEDTNLQMVERDRKADERKLAALGVQLQDANAYIAELEKKLAAASKPKDEKKGE